ncbi:MAG TPA: cyclic nucleotide-binding domain-containing protein [Pyrinomonadaceae bacterium]|nr:cyclic nucleotide-binding domain-containing protein [Pyrinomonadaceae bacterium]
MARPPLRRRLALPLAALALFALIYYSLPALTVGVSEESRKLIGQIVLVGLWLCVAVLAVRLGSALVFELLPRLRRVRETPRFVQDIFALIAYILLTALVLKSVFPDISLGALLSGSAVVGVILGLALQETLGNLFAGLSLQADRPFELGDVITVGTFTGVVESITWRAVKIRTFQNHVVLLGNAQLAKESIQVFPRENQNARLVFFNAIYTDSPAKVIHVIREAVREVENVSQAITPIVRIRALADFAVDYEVKYWLIDYTKFNDTDALIRQRIWYAYRRNGISFAYPTQTLYLDRPARQTEKSRATRLDRLTERLSAVDIFSPLTQEELARLAAAAGSHTYAPGETIIRAGEAGDSMFVVNRGSIEVRISDNGRPRTVAALGEGQFFGEMALLTGQPRTANIVAVEETEVLEIGHDALKGLFESNPDLVESLSHTVAERRAGLDASASAQRVEEEKHSIFDSIVNFFGLRRTPPRS